MLAGLLPGQRESLAPCVYSPIPINGRFVVKSKYFKGGQCVVTEACLAIFFFFLVPEPMIYDLQLQPTLLQK